ncbi:MAG: LCP family protein [Oscillospiraceae bacterium]|nr:LCP family protein [Oscillospiraceae bacterium]
MEGKQKKSKHRGWLIALCIILGVLLTLVIAATAFLESFLGLIKKPEPVVEQEFITEEEYMQEVLEEEPTVPEEEDTTPTEDPDAIVWSDAETIGAGQDIINILLIGQDRRSEKRARSDTMILCTLNKKEKTITLTSFMRDLYVQIPGYKDNRMNASYAFGGMELLDATLVKNFGVEVDGNIEVDFNGFESVVDAIGGVDIYLKASEARHMMKQAQNGAYGRPMSWELSEGVNHLDGAQALAYARNRSTGGDGDFGRTNRQRTVLNAVFQKAKSMSLTETINLIKTILPLLTTDLTDAQILGFAMEAFPLLPELQMNTQRIPADGTYRMTRIRGMSVIVPNFEENRDVLKEIMKTE